MKRLIVGVGVVCLFAAPAEAQIVQSATRFAVPGELESEKNARVKEGADKAQTIPQANVDASSEGTKVGIQAADLFFHKYIRFYGRVTLPVTQKKADPKKAQDEEGNDTGATPTEVKLSSTAKQQLIDPYGGIANISGGVFKSIWSFEAKEEIDIPAGPDTSARSVRVDKVLVDTLEMSTGSRGKAAEDATKVEPSHGLFLDVRGGVKFIELPDPGESNPEVAGTKANVFYTGIIGLKTIAALYTHPDRADDHRTGGLTLGVYYVYNYAADTTQSSVYGTLLNRQMTAWTAVLGWDLPNTEVAALTFSMTPKTSDKRVGKSFTFGLTLKNKTAAKKE